MDLNTKLREVNPNFKPRVRYKSTIGKFIKYYLDDNDILYADISFENGGGISKLNLEKAIEFGDIEVCGYPGDFIEYIKKVKIEQSQTVDKNSINRTTRNDGYENEKSINQAHHNSIHQAKNSVEEKVLIQNYLQERGIKKLMHFTNIENLNSILKNGICSNLYCEKNGINCVRSDSERIDGLKDYISFSVEFPNYKMFYSKRNEINAGKYAILIVDISILDLFNEDSWKFSNTNAAANNKKIGSGLNDLKELFYDDNLRDNLNLPDNYTTDPQAEVLLKGRVPVDYINKIIFPKELKYWDMREHIDNVEYRKLIDVNGKLFQSRRDWMHWRNEGTYYGDETYFYFF